MKTSINNLALLNRATNMVIKGHDLNNSLKISAMIEFLQLKMMSGVVHFLFRKKNGEIREVWGTLLPRVVTNNIIGTGEPRRIYNCQAFFDVESQYWKSFRYENLLAILD